MIRKPKHFAALILIVASVANGSSLTFIKEYQTRPLGVTDAKSRVMTEHEYERVKQAADHFVQRFHQTLDFATAFNEMKANNAIKVLRHADFFKSINMSQKLIDELDDATLERTYKAYMNEYYLRGAYDLSMEPLESGANARIQVPPEVEAAIKSSKYEPLLAAGWSGDLPTINTLRELDDYLQDLEFIASLYRKHLSNETFNSVSYKAGINRVNRYRSTKSRVMNGLPEFGISSKVKAYVIERDYFIFVFVTERGNLKVLALIIGS